MLTRQTFVSATAALLVAVALAACTSGGSGAQRTSHADGDGPLSVQAAPGATVVRPNNNKVPWSATFGSMTPCVTGHETVTIDAIRPHVVTEPVEVSTGVRTVPPIAEQTGPGWGGVIFLRGPLNVTEPKAPSFIAGAWDEDPAGTKISVSCDDWPGDGEYTELLMPMSANRDGAEVDRTYIDYTTDSGKKYTLEVELDFIMCGDRIDDPDCP
jgi:hypothetical protein